MSLLKTYISLQCVCVCVLCHYCYEPDASFNLIMNSQTRPPTPSFFRRMRASKRAARSNQLQASRRQARKPARKQTSQPASKEANQPASQPVSQSASQPARKQKAMSFRRIVCGRRARPIQDTGPIDHRRANIYPLFNCRCVVGMRNLYIYIYILYHVWTPAHACDRLNCATLGRI